MKIGDLDIEDKLIMAPLADVSDAPLRVISKEFGAGLTFTQMISAEGVIKNSFRTLRFLSFHKDEKPIAVQLLGNDTGHLSEAISEILKLKPDLIDLNCSCPVETVMKYSLGASILSNPLLLGQLVRSMKDASGKIPVSVKLRLGDNKNSISILKNAKTAEENGADLIIVHGRTLADKYRDPADWEWISRVKKEVKIPIVGNGSVFSPQDALAMKNETGCDTVMVARGALGNPFIFSRFNKLVKEGVDPGLPPVEEVKDVALRHIEKIYSLYPDFEAKDRSKKTVIWYFKNYSGISELLKNIFNCNDFESMRRLILNHTANILEKKFDGTEVLEIEKKFRDRIVFWN